MSIRGQTLQTFRRCTINNIAPVACTGIAPKTATTSLPRLAARSLTAFSPPASLPPKTLWRLDSKIDGIERGLHAESNNEYQADGGRDIPTHKHPRSHDQRNFDAAQKLLTRNPDCDHNQEDSAQDNSDVSGRGRKRRRPTSHAGRRVTVFVTATTDQLNGTDLSPLCTVDGKPLPPSFVDEIAGDAAFIAQLFSTKGQLLWQGRERRLATPAQIDGLISRDRGCVQCNAHHDRCVAHHLIPWEAPRKGPTNINNLVLLCVDCHVRLHRANRTMFYDLKTQTWNSRPATPAETPPNDHRSNSPPTAGKPGRYERAKLWERPPKPGIRPKLEEDEESSDQPNKPDDGPATEPALF